MGSKFLNISSFNIITIRPADETGHPVTAFIRASFYSAHAGIESGIRRVAVPPVPVELHPGSGAVIGHEYQDGIVGRHDLCAAQADIGIAHGSDVEMVKKLMVAIAGEIPEILAEPQPEAYFVSFGESALNLALFFWAIAFGGATFLVLINKKIKTTNLFWWVLGLIIILA